MKKMLILLMSFISAPLLWQEQRGWRGIVPLRSTRSYVESLLGTSTDECRCLYKAEDAVVYVEYARGLCKDALHDWNVPPDTVLSLTVRQNVWQPFSNFAPDLSKLVMRQDDTLTKYYTDKDKGIEYTVSTDGVVTAVSYVPSSNDSHLLCSGSLANNRQAPSYPPFDSYSDIPIDDEKDRLDGFAVQLHQSPNTTGYVVVYAGRRTPVGEAKARAERAKKYLINKRGIEAGRIITIDGGHREGLMVELYLAPRGTPAPIATPTVTPSQVKIITDSNTRNNNQRSSRRSKQRPPCR